MVDILVNIINNIDMKKLIILIVLIFGLSLNTCHAFSYKSINSAYTNNARMQAKYCPRNMYDRRYQRTNYIYTPQQARYNGYRTDINGFGYNNPYYYNRYRR